MGSLSAPAAPVAAPAPRLGMAQDPAAMRRAAEKFEAQALSALLRPGFDAAAPKGSFTGGAAEEQWRPMLVDAYAEAWVKRGGIGLSGSVMMEMLRMQSAAGASSHWAAVQAAAGTPGAAVAPEAAVPAGNAFLTLSRGESVP